MIDPSLPSERMRCMKVRQMICFRLKLRLELGSRRLGPGDDTKVGALLRPICSAWGEDCNRLRVAVHGQHGATREICISLRAEPRWRERPPIPNPARVRDNSPML